MPFLYLILPYTELEALLVTKTERKQMPLVAPPLLAPHLRTDQSTPVALQSVEPARKRAHKRLIVPLETALELDSHDPVFSLSVKNGKTGLLSIAPLPP